MRGKIFFFVCLLLCAVLGAYAYLTNSQRNLAYTFYLETAPADPRALFMGDYMRLSYAFEREANGKEAVLCAVPETRERKAGELQEITQAGVLTLNAQGDYCMTVPYKSGRYRVPHQFFFQEGTGKKYEGARYAAVRNVGKDRLVIVGLADENFNWIE